MPNMRRWVTGLLLAAVLGASATGAAMVSAAPAGAGVPLQPPTPTAPPVDAGPAPSAAAGDFLVPPPGCTGLPSFPPTNNTAQNIPDAVGPTPGIITSTIHISTTGVYLWQVFVTTNLTHPVSSDLDIELVSPHGTVVTLSSNNGGPNANVFNGTIWFDTASNNGLGVVTLASYISGTLQPQLSPEEPLSALVGENPNGDWKLVVKDTAANGKTGRLKSWSLAMLALAQTPHTIGISQTNSGVSAIPDDGGDVKRFFYFYGLPTGLATLTLTTDLPHTYPGDLDISLVSPVGLTVTVSQRNSGAAGYSFGNGSLSTVWTDKAGQTNPPGAVTDAHYVSGTVQSALAPQAPFGSLQGRNPSGQWTLIVADRAPEDVGTLYNVTLAVGMDTCLPDLSFEYNSTPYFPKLGQPGSIGWGTRNNGALAHNLVTSGTLSGPFPFLGVFGDGGLACGAPAPGTLNATAHCGLASLDNNAEPGVVITFGTPLIPTSANITITVGSNTADLDPSNNTHVGQLTAFAHSANGNPWDVLDKQTLSYADYTNDPPDSGSIVDAGQDAFDGFGQISVRVFTGINTYTDADIEHLGLTYAAGGHWQTTTPQTVSQVQISRSLLAPPGQDWLRYVDSFTNNAGTARTVWVAWGGNLGSDDQTATRATSSGDLNLTAADTWAVTQQDFIGGYEPDAVLGYALRAVGDTSYQGPFDTDIPLTNTVWSSAGDDNLSHVYKLTIPAGGTQRLAYFVYRGLAETVPGPIDCGFYGGCVTPGPGTQVTLVRNAVTALVANGPFCDLPAAVRASIVNWPGIGASCKGVFLPLVQK